MNICLCQLNPIVGDLCGNTQKILDIIKTNYDQKREILIFPELAITGYPPLDLVNNKSFIREQLKYKDIIVNATKNFHGLVIFGYIEENNGNGKNLFNSALVCHNGEELYNYRKRLLPTYDIFDEARYFEPGQELGLFQYKDKRIGIVICEDLWKNNKLYHNIDIALELFNSNADLVISLNASPSIVKKYSQRVKMIRDISIRYALPIIYVNQVGGNDDIIFDGNSFVTNRRGKLVLHMSRFKEELSSIVDDNILETHSPLIGFNGLKIEDFESDAQFFYEQAILGIKDYIGKCGFSGVIIGESGGIDSAVVTALAVDALGIDRVKAVTMPSQYSSVGSYKDSELLCKNLGIDLYHYNISNSFDVLSEEFDNVFGIAKRGVTEENMQARIRGQILMAYANRNNYLVLSTGNKSELSVGYCVCGDSYIRNNIGMLTAEELYDQFNDKVYYKDNGIYACSKSIKNIRYNITTAIGNELSTSNDHEYKIYDSLKKEYYYKKAEDIKEGDLLVLRIGSNLWGNTISLPEFKYKKEKFDFRSFDFNPPKELSEELSTFIGICIADGSYSNGSVYRIRSSKQYVADFCLNFLSKINLQISCYYQTPTDENGCFFIEICSVQFVDWLYFIGIKHGSLIKDIPLIIRKAPENIVKAFISGVFLDSNANNKKNRAEITYHSSSIILAKQVHLILLNLGILSYFKYYNKKNIDNTMYEVYIPSYETYKLLDFPLLKKSIIKRIENNLEIKKIKTFIDYVYGYEEDIMSIKSKINESKKETLRRAFRKSPIKIGRQTLEKYALMLPDNDLNKDKILNKLKSDEYIIPCMSIYKKVGNYEMYDFSIENIHEFNANSIDVHNCTIYGDMAGGLSPISDMYKMEVYSVAKYYNKLHSRDIIPLAIIDKEPSAELSPGQKDTDNLPPYPILDAILKYIIEGNDLDEIEKEKINTIIHSNKEYYNKVCKMIQRAEFKRRQAPIGLKMHQKAFGFGRRMPIVQKWIG
jgi:NH3-dependent NAD+ synthetase/predicted amidohydrolase/intein/homing endonuclease